MTHINDSTKVCWISSIFVAVDIISNHLGLSIVAARNLHDHLNHIRTSVDLISSAMISNCLFVNDYEGQQRHIDNTNAR